MKLTEKQLYWAWLQSVPQVGPVRFYQLLAQTNNDPRQVFELARSDPKSLSFVGDAALSILKSNANEQKLESLAAAFERSDIRIVIREDEHYPELLKHVYCPPPLLYLRGNSDLLNAPKSIAIVGTRKCSAYGGEMAYSFAYELAERGITVVSGMALGIDALAHRGALDSLKEASTIAVMGGGVDVPYPAENRAVFDKILERGLVVSEFPPGMPSKSGNFPMRNRVIAGLTFGTLVAEAAKRSGTWHTVDFALDSGREVFVIPSRITDLSGEGSLEMLKLGAKLVTCVDEIVEEFASWNRKKTKKQPEPQQLDLEEAAVYTALERGEKSADELFEATRIPMHRLLSLLTKLTHKGIIKRTDYMNYHI